MTLNISWKSRKSTRTHLSHLQRQIEKFFCDKKYRSFSGSLSTSYSQANLSFRLPLQTRVRVLLPSAFTPLANMHICSATTSTLSQSEGIFLNKKLAKLSVNLSWVWSFLEKWSTILENFERPKTFPSLGKYEILTVPKKGNRWCSHNEKKGI